IRRALVALLAIAVLLAAIAAWLLRGSLPVLGGQRTLPALAAPVSIQRDALGVVTIEAASQADALRALGYVHAQERYFEMDLMRRNAAGELAALFGPAALPVDRAQRIHRMRARTALQLAVLASGDGEHARQTGARDDVVGSLGGRAQTLQDEAGGPAAWARALDSSDDDAIAEGLQDGMHPLLPDVRERAP